MANTKVYTIQINGVDQSVSKVEELVNAVDTLGNSIEVVDSETKDLQETVSKSTNTINSLKESVKALQEEFEGTEIGSERFKELQEEIIKVNTQLESYNTTAQETKQKSKDLNDEVIFSSKSLGGLKQQVSKLEQEFEKAEFGTLEFQKLQGELIEAKSKLKEVDEATEGLTSQQKLEAVAGLGEAITGAFAIGSVVESFVGDTQLAAEAQEKVERALVLVQSARAIAEGVKQAAILKTIAVQKIQTLTTKNDTETEIANVAVKKASTFSFKNLTASIKSAGPALGRFGLYAVAAGAALGGIIGGIKLGTMSTEELVRKFKSLDGWVKVLIVGFGLMAAPITAIVGIFFGLTKIVTKLLDTFKGLKEGFYDFFGIQTEAAAAAQKYNDELYEQIQLAISLKKATEEYNDALNAQAVALARTAEAAALLNSKYEITKLNEKNKELGAGLELLTKKSTELKNGLKKIGGITDFNELQKKVLLLKGSFEGMGIEIDDAFKGLDFGSIGSGKALADADKNVQILITRLKTKVVQNNTEITKNRKAALEASISLARATRDSLYDLEIFRLSIIPSFANKEKSLQLTKNKELQDIQDDWTLGNIKTYQEFINKKTLINEKYNFDVAELEKERQKQIEESEFKLEQTTLSAKKDYNSKLLMLVNDYNKELKDLDEDLTLDSEARNNLKKEAEARYLEEKRKLLIEEANRLRDIARKQNEIDKKLEEDAFKAREREFQVLERTINNTIKSIDKTIEIESVSIKSKLALLEKERELAVQKINEALELALSKPGLTDPEKAAIIDKANNDIQDINEQIDKKIDTIKPKSLFGKLLGISDASAEALGAQLEQIGSQALDLLEQFDEKRLEQLDEFIAEREELIAELEASAQESLQRTSELENNLVNSRLDNRDAILKSLEKEKLVLQALEAQKQKALEDERKAAAEREQLETRRARLEKLINIADVIQTTALGIMNIFADKGNSLIPVPARIPLAIAVGALGATQLGAIVGSGFAEGGFTGKGSKYEPAGIVHRGEYVIPKWLVENPKMSGTIQNIEQKRLKGFAEGGLVTPNVTFNNDFSNVEERLNSLENALINRPIFVSVESIDRVRNDKNSSEAQATL